MGAPLSAHCNVINHLECVLYCKQLVALWIPGSPFVVFLSHALVERAFEASNASPARGPCACRGQESCVCGGGTDWRGWIVTFGSHIPARQDCKLEQDETGKSYVYNITTPISPPVLGPVHPFTALALHAERVPLLQALVIGI